MNDTAVNGHVFRSFKRKLCFFMLVVLMFFNSFSVSFLLILVVLMYAIVEIH
jgi:hypothetical protein